MCLETMIRMIVVQFSSFSKVFDNRERRLYQNNNNNNNNDDNDSYPI